MFLFYRLVGTLLGGGGGCHFFITLQFNHIYCVCGESKVPFITVLFITFFITFLIHSGSLQKMLTALFDLV